MRNSPVKGQRPCRRPQTSKSHDFQGVPLLVLAFNLLNRLLDKGEKYISLVQSSFNEPDGSLKIEQQLVLLTPIRGTRVIPRPFSLERR